MERNISTFIIIHSPALYAISESVLLRLLLLPIAAQQQQGALGGCALCQKTSWPGHKVVAVYSIAGHKQ